MDQSRDDNGAELYKLARLYDAPDFVKAAARKDLRPDNPVPPAYYGDPRRLLYPLHHKAATWASYAFFLDKRASLHPTDAACIEERILQAGAVHGVRPALDALKAAHARAQSGDPGDARDEDYAIVVRDGNAVERYMPLRNSIEVKRGADYFLRHRDRLPFDERREVAGRILQKAAEHCAALGDAAEQLEKQAGLGACQTAAVVAAVRDRVATSRRGPGELDDYQQGLLKLADILAARPASLRESAVRVKVAKAIDDFDRVTGLVGLVRDGSLPRVEDVLFPLTREKMASAASELTSTTTGHLYHLADVEKLKLASVRAQLGADIAEALTANGIHVSGDKAARVVPTLPRGDAEVFDRLMSQAGLQPVAKQAAAQPIQLDRQFLLEVAQRYRQPAR